MRNSDGKSDLRARLKEYALRIIHLYDSLPARGAGQVIGHQVLRSGTSIGAHHREAHRARSSAEFVSKMEIAVQELDETVYWLELLVESGIVPEKKLKLLIQETNELLAIFTASVRTAKAARTK